MIHILICTMQCHWLHCLGSLPTVGKRETVVLLSKTDAFCGPAGWDQIHGI